MHYIFCDGSTMKKDNKFIAGWSYVITDNKMNIIACDFGKVRGDVTNANKAEVEACYQALLCAKDMHKNSKFAMYSDSEVLLKSILGTGKRKHFRDIWDLLEPLIQDNFVGRLHPVHLNSHTGDNTVIAKLNALVDRYAKNSVENLLINPANN